MSVDLIEVQDLSVEFDNRGKMVPALKGISFRIRPGSTVALVGESGSGKSVTAQAIMGILPKTARIASGRILFTAPGSKKPPRDITKLKPDGIEVLKQMGVLFKTASFKEIRVAGHSDKASASDGSSQYFEKLALSKARATQTVRVLKGDGVDSQSFIVEWYGDIRPIASNETEDGRQLNRRVEIVLYAGI